MSHIFSRMALPSGVVPVSPDFNATSHAAHHPQNLSQQNLWTQPPPENAALPLADHYVGPSRSHHHTHHSEGFVPDYVLGRMQAQSSQLLEPELEGINQARGDMRWVQQAKNPQFSKARVLYEQIYSGQRTLSSLSVSEWALIARFSDLLKRLFEWVFGRKSPPAKITPGSRHIYDAENTRTLRRRQIRAEGQEPINDADADSAYDYAGKFRTFLSDVLGMNSIDGRGMSIHQTVHYGVQYANAFWTGSEMAYGDGDGVVFGSFAQDSTVVHHELGHGIVEFHNQNGGLEYYNESGALNESFADINAIAVLHYMKGIDVMGATREDWLIGARAMVPYTASDGTKIFPALRSFLNEKAFENHPVIGTDDQPKHMRDKYVGNQDNGGVHINSGIANHAFYLAAHAVGGRVWETTYQVWVEALKVVPMNCTFVQFAQATVEAATRMALQPGSKINREDAVKIAAAWRAVGVFSDAGDDEQSSREHFAQNFEEEVTEHRQRRRA